MTTDHTPSTLPGAKKEADRLRSELVETLSAIEEKLNVPRRVGRGVEESKERLATLRSEKPAAFAAGALGVTAIVGTVAWRIARGIFSR
jgi:uncharacterized protein (UPF0147 family)